MHRCLWIPDIVATIIEEIAAYDEHGRLTSSSRSTLAKLTQTCRMLSEPSLNSLWKVQTSLDPLLRTMPSDIWQQNQELVSNFGLNFEYPWTLTVEHPIKHIRRPIKPADWARFHTYARRIYHFIRNPRPGRWTPTHERLQTLACLKPRDMVSLCPQVRSLYWPSLARSGQLDHLISFKYMPLFMGEYTTKLMVRLDTLDPAELAIIKSILCIFPSIRDLNIWNLTTDLDEEALSECLSHGQSLQAVSISHDLPQAAVEHLAGFQHLKRLEVTIEHGISSPRLSGFCALEELDVTGDSFSMISTVMNMLNSQSPLRNISLTMYMEDVEIDAHELSHTFDTIGLHCSHLHLQSLEVHASYWSYSDSPHSTIDATAFEPLLQFQNLSSLNLGINAHFHIGNQAVRDMVSAWPQLTSLIIGLVGWSGGTYITPAGLVHLLRLPHLHTLSISIDASKVDVDLVLDSENTLPKNTKIRYLDLQDSVIYDAEPMAALLSIVTPNIQKIEAWEVGIPLGGGLSEELAQEYQDRWSEVAHRVRDWRCSEETV